MSYFARFLSPIVKLYVHLHTELDICTNRYIGLVPGFDRSDPEILLLQFIAFRAYLVCLLTTEFLFSTYFSQKSLPILVVSRVPSDADIVLLFEFPYLDST